MHLFIICVFLFSLKNHFSFSDFLDCIRIYSVQNFLKSPNREPACHKDNYNLPGKLDIKDRVDLKQIVKEVDAAHIDNDWSQNGNDHFISYFSNFHNNIKQLNEYQSSKWDWHYHHKWIIEKKHCQKHYHCRLIKGFPNPYQKCLRV